MVEDLAQMGLYKEAKLNAADKVNQMELRKALFLKMAGKGSPKRRTLGFGISQAGGGIG